MAYFVRQPKWYSGAEILYDLGPLVSCLELVATFVISS